ncbi:MAG: sigma-70 family RNA polymerase sigma factor [Ignavibacteria bacterium]|jgi:RNA polymerase sigma-70 factor (ECF subfamily)|nr:sigma-70 family RNA polymerase sigma factor [Ignavibacteria bacterium]HEX2963069.1 sigma-70 family RNA polymerase sigma factor [Ignavibacteriales bacterium]MCU7500695.1 sigma-70 family RNA polymerase sigma factor [Ignavibacteria bacterium]MCU7511312.1 sigma-70 family RNA polymerase sigma factor [Ignavibacteria bacterium]MCU7518966.1 sigma-70 family RNA polymerase sigma factor [Ignavibacteria bacterium]
MDLTKDEVGLSHGSASNTDDDFALIKRFIDGDESSFRVLVLRHKDKVRNLVFLTVGNREMVDDISQDVFITVFNKLKSFRFESQFTTWLYRITVNKCKDQLRKQRIRSIFVPMKDTEEELGGMRHEAEYVDTTEIVQQAIQKLPEKLRVPLLMREIDGQSYKEIADSLGCEVGTIKSRIFRARESLKYLLQPFERDLMI